MSNAAVSKFTPEELEELRRFDASIDNPRGRPPLTPEERYKRRRESQRRYEARKRAERRANKQKEETE